MHPGMHYLHMGAWPCYVGFAATEEAFVAEMKRLNVPDAPRWLNGSATTHCFDSSRSKAMTCIVTMDPSKRWELAQVAALFAHEALHVVQFMRDDYNRGKPFDNETESYLVQYMTQEFCNLRSAGTRKRATSA